MNNNGEQLNKGRKPTYNHNLFQNYGDEYNNGTSDKSISRCSGKY